MVEGPSDCEAALGSPCSRVLPLFRGALRRHLPGIARDVKAGRYNSLHFWLKLQRMINLRTGHVAVIQIRQDKKPKALYPNGFSLKVMLPCECPEHELRIAGDTLTLWRMHTDTGPLCMVSVANTEAGWVTLWSFFRDPEFPAKLLDIRRAQPHAAGVH